MVLSRLLVTGGFFYYSIVRLLSSEVVRSFTGVYFGMFVGGPEGIRQIPALFDWFGYKPD
jgi:hypothetical protein